MATTVIEGGTARLGDVLYEYRYNTVDGEVVVPFTATQVPKVGDSIVDGFLVPLVGIKRNNDHSKWYPEQTDTWGRDI